MLDMVAGGGVAASERGGRPQMALAGSVEAAVVRVESGCGSTRDWAAAGQRSCAERDVPSFMRSLAQIGEQIEAGSPPLGCSPPGGGVLLQLAAGRVATEAEVAQEEAKPQPVERPGPEAVRAAMRYCRQQHFSAGPQSVPGGAASCSQAREKQMRARQRLVCQLRARQKLAAQKLCARKWSGVSLAGASVKVDDVGGCNPGKRCCATAKQCRRVRRRIVAMALQRCAEARALRISISNAQQIRVAGCSEQIGRASCRERV